MADRQPMPAAARAFRVEISGLAPLGGWVDPGVIGWGYHSSTTQDQPNGFPRAVPEERYCDKLRLSRRFDGTKDLRQWAAKAASEPRDGSIIWLQPDGSEIRQNWSRGWCSRCERGRDQKAGILLETVEIEVEDLFDGQ